jgi:hypothetical protein
MRVSTSLTEFLLILYGTLVVLSTLMIAVPCDVTYASFCVVASA